MCCLFALSLARLESISKVALGSATSGTGLTPLGVACLAGHAEVARELLRAMAPVDVRDARGNTVLHAAQMGGIEKDLMPSLLAAKADPEASQSRRSL